MNGSRAGPNPYVGPRPFETGEALFGRDRELRELFYLLSGERIVLLQKLKDYNTGLRKSVEEKDAKLQKTGYKEYGKD